MRFQALPLLCGLASLVGAHSILVIPFAMTAPEYGVAFGVKARDRGLFGGPGYGDLTGMASTRSQAYAEFSGLRDSLSGIWRIGGAVEGGVFPELYATGSPGRMDSLACYTPTYLTVDAYGGRIFPHGLHVDLGLSADLESIRLDDTIGDFVDPSQVREAGGGSYFRLTGNVGWNGRDHDDDPRHGGSAEFHWELPLPGSDAYWESGHLEGTWAFTPADGGPTAAMRLREEGATGDVPFWQLPYAGSKKILRGVQNHRVRGRFVQTAGMELRQPFPFLAWQWQLTAFAEAARAGDARSVWSRDPVFGLGGGLRLLLDDRHAVLRGDLGWNTTEDATLFPSIYIDFGQAF